MLAPTATNMLLVDCKFLSIPMFCPEEIEKRVQRNGKADVDRYSHIITLQVVYMVSMDQKNAIALTTHRIKKTRTERTTKSNFLMHIVNAHVAETIDKALSENTKSPRRTVHFSFFSHLRFDRRWVRTALLRESGVVKC